MENDLIGHEVKIVYEEDCCIRVLRGILQRLDNQFAYLERMGGDMMISTKTILQIKPDFKEKSDDYGSRNR